MSDETQFQNFANLPPQVVNIREGYRRLECKVHRSLRTQQGDATHLAQRSEQVAQFLSAAEQHADLFSAAEFSTLRTNAAKMQASLEKAAEESTLGTKEPPPKVMQKVQLIRRGNAERQGKPYIGSRECPGLLRVFSGYPDAEARGSILVIVSKQYDGINPI
ncbi:hypothetical protein GGX14DRAFT_388911 [Mycena pura]|uniref:Uncharacterized protein n=1 Tax=Mycena pura TaxID=153505 RepID=A0AAD6VU55_9AGAR|nr:hypothetical protein GGX14DRAFT_388911 [Mycena pura]